MSQPRRLVCRQQPAGSSGPVDPCDPGPWRREEGPRTGSVPAQPQELELSPMERHLYHFCTHHSMMLAFCNPRSSRDTPLGRVTFPDDVPSGHWVQQGASRSRALGWEPCPDNLTTPQGLEQLLPGSCHVRCHT